MTSYRLVVINASEELAEYIFRVVWDVKLSDAQMVDHTDLNSDDNR